MALFGSARDASLIRHINNELIVNIIDTEIELYKLVLDVFSFLSKKYYRKA